MRKHFPFLHQNSCQMRPWALLAGPVAHAALLCLLDGTHEVAGGLDKVTFPSIGVRHRQIFHRMASEGDAGLSAALGQGLRLRGHDIDSAEECSSCVGGEILDEGLRGSRESWAIERREAVGVSMPIREGLRLRGGIGEAAGSIVSYASGIALDVEGNEFREFGTGPGTLDLSSSRMEAMPDSYNQEDSLMDGLGGILWDYPEKYRLVGEHFIPREFWARFNFTDFWDGWDHQSDRLGTIIGIVDDGISCEGWCSATDVELAVRDRAIFVQQLFVWMIGMRNEMVEWDEVEDENREASRDWYATGYLTQYFLSLAEDDLQPEWPDQELEKIKEMEEQLAAMKLQYSKTGTCEPTDGIQEDSETSSEEQEEEDVFG